MNTSYLCGYLKIIGLTEEYPTLTTFFDGEIISEKHPFLTRKWDADEEVDRKHWVIETYCPYLQNNLLFHNQASRSFLEQETLHSLLSTGWFQEQI